MSCRSTLFSPLLFGLVLSFFSLSGQKLPDREGGDEGDYAAEVQGFFPFETKEKALGGAPGESSRRIKAESAWKYRSGTPGKPFPEEFYTSPAADASWDTLKAGFPPAVEVRGKLLLSRRFQLDEEALAGQVFLAVPGLRRGYRLWLNGKPLQYGQEASAPGEPSARTLRAGRGAAGLDISSMVRAGGNRLVLELEECASPACGTFPLMSQELWVYTRPRIYIRELRTQSSLSRDLKKGTLELQLTVDNRMDSVKQRLLGVLKEAQFATVNIEAQLVDEEGKMFADLKQEDIRIRGGQQEVVSLKGEFAAPLTWSHETPHLYSLEIQLKDAEGRVLEAVSRKLGFRNAVAEEGGLLINGRRVGLKPYSFAVSPDHAILPAVAGYDSIKALMLREMEKIKGGHFNLVFAGPFSGHPLWYALCERYGVYVAETPGPWSAGSPALVPELLEFRQSLPRRQQHVQIQLMDFLKSTLRIKNGYAFRDLSNFYLHWEVLENGVRKEEGRIDKLPLKPGEESVLTLGYRPRFYKGNDYFLNVSLLTHNEEPMIPAGSVLASGQFRLGPYRYERTYEADKGQVDALDDPGEIVLNGYDFRIVFDKSSGSISRFSYRGKELMDKGPELGFRDPQLLPDSLRASYDLWSEAAREGQQLEYKITEDVNGNYYLSFTTVLLGGDARLFRKYRVDGRGSVLVENVFVRLEGDHPALPGLGSHFELPEEYEKLEWYGRSGGKQSPMGIYSGFIRETGQPSKTEVRWLRLMRKDGFGLQITGEGAFLNFSALQHLEGESPALLNVNLTEQPLPYKSYTFNYRISPYIAPANAQ